MKGTFSLKKFELWYIQKVVTFQGEVFMKLFIFLLVFFSMTESFACKPAPELLNWVEEYKNARNRTADILISMKSLENPSNQERSGWVKALGDAKKDMATHRNNIKSRYGTSGSCVAYVGQVFASFPEP